MEKRPPLLSITLLSAGTLVFEILLMRLFSIIQWHHFAYMVISLALLGYGMSGTFISIAQQHLQQRYKASYTILILLFAFSSVGSFFIAQAIPFNAEEILWDIKQTVYLSAIFAVLAIPFFFAASAMCLTLRCYGDQVPRIYGYDLVGAGCGSITVIALLYICLPQTALVCTSLIILLAALVAIWEVKLNHRRVFTVVIVLVAIAIASTLSQFQLNLSPYKGLMQALRINGTKVIEEYSSPLGLLSILESTEVPLRFAPGLSLNNYQEPLEQLGVFTDGDSMAVITKVAENRDQLAYLNQVSSALPFYLKRPERVLLLGAGGGADILQAQYHVIPNIDVVELNPQVANLIQSRYANYAGEIFSTTTKLYVNEARGFVENTEKQYDLIQLALTDGFTGSAAGVYALNESYLYTVEGIRSFISRLAPGGYLAITRWIKMPPRDTLKLFATAVQSLKGLGVKRPANRLMLIRSWQTSTLLIKQGNFTDSELLSAQNFCTARSFDIAFSPKMTKNQANRHNVLSQPLYYKAAQSLVGGRAETFMDSYKFNIVPATDDKPYFHHFFKWSSLFEILHLRQQGSMVLLESGYLVLVATLAVAVLISSVLILVPLLLLQKESLKRVGSMKKGYVFIYFFLIGIAFLFIEIGFLQKMILFLHHPIFSISTGLAAFLIFAGLGSHVVQKTHNILTLKTTLFLVISGIVMFSVFYVFVLDHLFTFFAEEALIMRMAIAAAVIAPLATFMGMPFSTGLKDLADRAEQLVPWAWGINGCASVISAVLATLVGIHLGFTMLIFMAVILYVIAWLALVASSN